MREADVIELVGGLAGVEVMTAGPDTGAPEVAWGDSFFFYDPDGDGGVTRQPFATVVTSNYPGFDTASDLDRPGVFRVNVAVERQTFEALLGYAPADHERHRADVDFAALDRLVPHPVYAAQGWVCVLNPGAATQVQLEALLLDAHARAAARHGRRRAVQEADGV